MAGERRLKWTKFVRLFWRAVNLSWCSIFRMKKKTKRRRWLLLSRLTSLKKLIVQVNKNRIWLLCWKMIILIFWLIRYWIRPRLDHHRVRILKRLLRILKVLKKITSMNLLFWMMRRRMFQRLKLSLSLLCLKRSLRRGNIK